MTAQINLRLPVSDPKAFIQQSSRDMTKLVVDQAALSEVDWSESLKKLEYGPENIVWQCNQGHGRL